MLLPSFGTQPWLTECPLTDLIAYGGLFLSALIAATLLPLQSEAVLVALVLAGQQPTWVLVAVATVGNVLGAVINWLLGCGIESFRSRRWFPVSPEALLRAKDRYRRYGRWALLLSWMPIIGDPITVVAGVLRESFWVFLALVTAAKLGRYLVVVSLLP
jgi:membrane protein YqaA with SNARE-associated domain